MKLYLISDNVDTLTGMRLAGIEGVVVHGSRELKEAVEKACADPEIAILLLTGPARDGAVAGFHNGLCRTSDRAEIVGNVLPAGSIDAGSVLPAEIACMGSVLLAESACMELFCRPKAHGGTWPGHAFGK